MSTQEQEQTMEMGTKPAPQHQWLQQLVGNWNVESEMYMPDGSTMKSQGTEKAYTLEGLWVIGEGKAHMPDGAPMEYRVGLGYDVSFKGYRGFMVMSVSSHLWKYEGTLSADGKTMTLDCVGPDMQVDGKTANYRDVIHIVDADHRTLTSSGQDANGEWQTYMRATYSRA